MMSEIMNQQNELVEKSNSYFSLASYNVGKMESKYYSYGIEINLLNVIIDHKFQIPNSFIFSDHQTGVCFSSILFHIGNDNIFSVRFSFEINYNFFLCCFPYGFGAREKENIKNLAPPVIFFFFRRHTHNFIPFFPR